MPRLAFALAAVALFSLSAQAEKNSQIEPEISKIGSPLVQEHFEGAALPDAMVPAKGEWIIVDGALHGKELASDKHAAVLNFQKPNRNSVVKFSFKFDGSTDGLNFSLNHKAGHLFRVVVASEKLTVNLDKDKKDPASKATVLGTAKGDFQPGQWYTIQVEMAGERVLVKTDTGLRIAAKHSKLDADKPNYRFVMRGDSLLIDDVQVWEIQ